MTSLIALVFAGAVCAILLRISELRRQITLLQDQIDRIAKHLGIDDTSAAVNAIFADKALSSSRQELSILARARTSPAGISAQEQESAKETAHKTEGIQAHPDKARTGVLAARDVENATVPNGLS